MAQSSTTKKKTTSKSNAKSAAKGKNTKNTAQKKPIRREIAGGIFALLGTLVLIGYFQKGSDDGFLVSAVCDVIKGLLGYGFYAVAPAFILTAVVLIFHRGRPVAWRMTAALFIPAFSSAFVDLLLSKLVLPATPKLISTLYATGVGMKCGGVIGGLLSYALSSAITKVAAGILLFLLILICIMAALNITVKKISQ